MSIAFCRWYNTSNSGMDDIYGRKYVSAAYILWLAWTVAILHLLWALGGQTVAGTRAELYLMWMLAALIVASVLFVLFAGGA